MLIRATALRPSCPHTVPPNPYKGAGDIGYTYSLQEQKSSSSNQVSLTKLHPLGLPTSINYQVLINSPILITKSNDQVLILAIYIHDVLSPLKQPHNPHFRKANI